MCFVIIISIIIAYFSDQLDWTIMPITKIFARQIFDSRGNPTVEVDLTTEKGKEKKNDFI